MYSKETGEVKIKIKDITDRAVEKAMSSSQITSSKDKGKLKQQTQSDSGREN